MTLPSNNTDSRLSREKIVDVLLKEHEITCSQIREMVSYSDRMFGLGITLVGAVFIYGVKERLAEVVVAVSFIFIALLLFSATIYTCIFSLGGYRLYVEEQLNHMLGRNLLKWERMAPHILHKSFPVLSMSIFISILVFAFIVFGWRSANDTFQPQVISLINHAYAIGGLLLLGSCLKLRRAHREAYQAAVGPSDSSRNNQIKKKILHLPGIRQIAVKVSRRRGEDIANQLQDLLGKTSAIIDIGCGTAGVTQALRRRGCDAIGADISDLVLFADVPVVLADGSRLPFKDKAFGVGLLHTTLHHVKHQERLLLEAKRVAQRIIVGEELVGGTLNHFVMSCYDSLVNLSFGGHPHNNRSDLGWNTVFASIGLRVIDVRHSRVFGFIRQAVYVLE